MIRPVWTALLLVAVAVSATSTRERSPEPPDADAPRATLDVRVDGFDSDAGTAGIALWNAPRGFPEDVEHAIATAWVAIHDGAVAARFDQLDPGTYAVTVFHDANDDREFKKNWLGIPREAWGVTNNARPRMRAPRFDEARLTLPPGEHRVAITVD